MAGLSQSELTDTWTTYILDLAGVAIAHRDDKYVRFDARGGTWEELHPTQWSHHLWCYPTVASVEQSLNDAAKQVTEDHSISALFIFVDALAEGVTSDSATATCLKHEAAVRGLQDPALWSALSLPLDADVDPGRARETFTYACLRLALREARPSEGVAPSRGPIFDASHILRGPESPIPEPHRSTFARVLRAAILAVRRFDDACLEILGGRLANEDRERFFLGFDEEDVASSALGAVHAVIIGFQGSIAEVRNRAEHLLRDSAGSATQEIVRRWLAHLIAESASLPVVLDHLRRLQLGVPSREEVAALFHALGVNGTTAELLELTTAVLRAGFEIDLSLKDPPAEWGVTTTRGDGALAHVLTFGHLVERLQANQSESIGTLAKSKVRTGVG